MERRTRLWWSLVLMRLGDSEWRGAHGADSPVRFRRKGLRRRSRRFWCCLTSNRSRLPYIGASARILFLEQLFCHRRCAGGRVVRCGRQRLCGRLRARRGGNAICCDTGNGRWAGNTQEREQAVLCGPHSFQGVRRQRRSEGIAIQDFAEDHPDLPGAGFAATATGAGGGKEEHRGEAPRSSHSLDAARRAAASTSGRV